MAAESTASSAEDNAGSATSLPSIDYERHVTSPPIDAAMRALIDDLRRQISAESTAYQTSAEIRHFCDDTTLHRYIRTRAGNGAAAKKLLLATLQWRLTTAPQRIAPSAVESEAKSGKIIVADYDRYQRPIMVMDNHYNTSKVHHDMITFLFFQMERARQRMNATAATADKSNGVSAAVSAAHNPVEKYLLFINLSRHSFWNQPPMSTSMETVTTLTERYPEHLGHAVCYQPPTIFNVLWTAVSPFLDARTKAKILFINGDVSLGSKNDVLLKKIIGDDWKRLCRIDTEGDARYDHSKVWPIVERQHADWIEQYDKDVAVDVSTPALTSAE